MGRTFSKTSSHTAKFNFCLSCDLSNLDGVTAGRNLYLYSLAVASRAGGCDDSAAGRNEEKLNRETKTTVLMVPSEGGVYSRDGYYVLERVVFTRKGDLLTVE